jgi:hypothetical protein
MPMIIFCPIALQMISKYLMKVKTVMEYINAVGFHFIEQLLSLNKTITVEYHDKWD